MAITVQSANDYILSYCLDVIDWSVLPDERKQSFLNVAERTLLDTYAKYIEKDENFLIPEDAIYETSNALVITFNDTNRLQKHGLENFSLVGLGSFEFRERMVQHQGEVNYADFIPKIAKDMINKANDLPINDSRVKWTKV